MMEWSFMHPELFEPMISDEMPTVARDLRFGFVVASIKTQASAGSYSQFCPKRQAGQALSD
jgi:hypothetical protein